MHFTTTAITTALLASTLALAREHEHPSVCSVSYAKHPGKISSIKSCCTQAHGTPFVNKIHKSITCSGPKFTLESFEQTEFYNCVTIGQGLEASCKAVKPSSVVPRTTVVSDCNVSYGRSKTNQRAIASCCTNAGGRAANHASQASERCTGLKGSKLSSFKKCVQNRKLSATCTAEPVAVVAPKPVATTAKVVATTPAAVVSVPHIGLVTQAASATPVVVQSEATPTPTLAPVNTDSSCNAMYMGDATVQAKIQSCCASAKGSVFLESATQTVVCNGLDSTSGEVQAFTDCVGADAPVICAL